MQAGLFWPGERKFCKEPKGNLALFFWLWHQEFFPAGIITLITDVKCAVGQLLPSKINEKKGKDFWFWFFGDACRNPDPAGNVPKQQIHVSALWVYFQEKWDISSRDQENSVLVCWWVYIYFHVNLLLLYCWALNKMGDSLQETGIIISTLVER